PKWTREEAERFASHVKVDEHGCWQWQAEVTFGYGRDHFRDGRWRSHRLSFVVLVGPIPDGLVIDHLCRNRACCNPDHLEAVTPRTNVLRGEGIAATNAAKTHCPKGHPYSPWNTERRRNGGRRCRACRSISARARYLRMKEAS
ncbi:MAG: HNH endonuclease signature motif containing protein, partial [Acidimicrobiia bacterium]